MLPMVIAGIGTANPPHRISSADAAEIAQAVSARRSPERGGSSTTMYRRSGVATRHSAVLTASDGDLDRRQSFFGAEEPTTLERMRRYEAEAGPLARRGRAVGPGRRRDRRRDGSRTWSPSRAPGSSRPGLRHRADPRAGLAAATSRGRTSASWAATARSTACAWPGRSPRPTRGRASCSAPSSCAACTTSTAGTPTDRRQRPLRRRRRGRRRLGRRPRRRRRAGLSAGRRAARCLIPDSDDAMTWRIGDHGFVMTLSPRVPELIAPPPPALAGGLAATARPDLGEVGSWAVHPGGPRILSAVGEALGLDRRDAPPRGRCSTITATCRRRRSCSSSTASAARGPAPLRGPGLRPGAGRRGGAPGLASARAEGEDFRIASMPRIMVRITAARVLPAGSRDLVRHTGVVAGPRPEISRDGADYGTDGTQLHGSPASSPSRVGSPGPASRRPAAM